MYCTKNLEQQGTHFHNSSTFLPRLSAPLVFSLIYSYVIATSPEQSPSLAGRLCDTLPILALLLISFLLLANQLYTLREVTRSKSDNFFPRKAAEGEMIIQWCYSLGSSEAVAATSLGSVQEQVGQGLG